jgi:hypothetical protein
MCWRVFIESYWLKTSSILSLKQKDTLLLPGNICYYPSPSPDILKGILYFICVCSFNINTWQKLLVSQKCNQSEAIKTKKMSLFFFCQRKKYSRVEIIDFRLFDNNVKSVNESIWVSQTGNIFLKHFFFEMLFSIIFLLILYR